MTTHHLYMYIDTAKEARKRQNTINGINGKEKEETKKNKQHNDKEIDQFATVIVLPTVENNQNQIRKSIGEFFSFVYSIQLIYFSLSLILFGWKLLHFIRQQFSTIHLITSLNLLCCSFPKEKTEFIFDLFLDVKKLKLNFCIVKPKTHDIAIVLVEFLIRRLKYKTKCPLFVKLSLRHFDVFVPPNVVRCRIETPRKIFWSDTA